MPESVDNKGRSTMGGATTSFIDTDLMESIDGNARELEELDNIME